MDIGDLQGACCIGVIIIFILFVTFNIINAPGLTPITTPNDAVTYNSNQSHAIEIISKSNSTVNVEQVVEDENSVTEYYTKETHGEDYAIIGDLIFDMSELKLNGSNTYSKPLDSAFKDLFDVAKSSNHYNLNIYKIAKHENGSNFFTDPSILL